MESFPNLTEPAQADDTWRAWYRLAFTQGLSYRIKLKLLKHFGSVEAVFEACANELAALVGESGAAAILGGAAHAKPFGSDDVVLPGSLQEALRNCEQWLSKSVHHHLLSLADPRYPARLLDLADPPLVLFVTGDPALLSRPGLAVVGSRSASAQGVENARAFAKALAAQRYNVVSGLALGIDAAAHQGALLADGVTVAVIGTGIDRVYPASHHRLAKRIAERGAIVSELPLGSPALPHHFPQRNRLIAALADGVLLVEAAKQSGSLITARLALEIGREVFAIPGSIHSSLSKGCHELIKQGAKLVESAQDIIEDLAPSFREQGAAICLGHQEDDAGLEHPTAVSSPSFKQTTVEKLGAKPNPILQAMGFEPVTVSELLRRCELPAQALHTMILELELVGQISRLDDGRLLQIVEAT